METAKALPIPIPLPTTVVDVCESCAKQEKLMQVNSVIESNFFMLKARDIDDNFTLTFKFIAARQMNLK